jgi:hypothetical protein
MARRSPRPEDDRYGQLNKYKIRDVQSIRSAGSSSGTPTDQEGFVAFMRSDGNLLDAGVAPVKYLEDSAA